MALDWLDEMMDEIDTIEMSGDEMACEIHMLNWAYSLLLLSCVGLG